MYLSDRDTIYNLNSWTRVSRGGMGGALIHLPDATVQFRLETTNIMKPIVLEALVELLHRGRATDLGVLDYSDFEAMYRDEVRRLERRLQLARHMES